MCNMNSCGDQWWIIILLLLFGNGCGNDNRFDCGGSNAWWIVILALLGAFGGGCGDNNCGCGGSCGC